MEITKELIQQYLKETMPNLHGVVEVTDVAVGGYKVSTPNKVDHKTVRLCKVQKWFEQNH